MALPFEFVIVDIPVSQQTRNRSRVREWTRQVRNHAQQSWEIGDLPHDGPVMVTITYCYDDVPMDVDNIPKPILDALNDLVYIDDTQVTDILCRKRDINVLLRPVSLSLILNQAIDDQKPFVHIRVVEVREQGVV